MALLPGTALAASGGPQDKYVISGDVLVAKGEAVGDVVVVDGDVTVRGDVHGDLVAIAGDVTIRGTVTGNVDVIGGHLTLGRRAHVGGDVNWAQNRPVLAAGAVVQGKVKKVGTGSISTPGFEVALGFWVITTISYLLAGLFLLLLAPRAGDAVVRAARAGRGRAIITGILLFIFLPIIAVILLVTVVGTPLGIGLLLALGPIYAIGYLSSGLLLGRRFVKSGGVILAFIVGMVILRILALIPLVGLLVTLLATIFGLGAAFVAMRRTRIA